MGLTMEDNIRRRNDERVQYIANNVCRNDSGKPYVFISYKSDDWEKVLQEIVYTLVKEKGLNVYFDGDFNGHNPLWTEQFPLNMESANCRGVLVFVDDEYTKSYATLMELLYSQAGCQEEKPPYNLVRKPVVTINLGELTQVSDSGNTGLGVGTYEDGKVNIHANDEKELFDDLFEKASELKIIKNTIKPYKKSKMLSKELCAAMCREVLATIGANDNLYGMGITLDDIVATIKDVCGEDVFESTVPDSKKTYKVTIRNDGENVLTIEEGELVPEQNPGQREGYEFKGWFYVVNNTEVKWDFTKHVNEDIELFAKWEEILMPPTIEGYTYTIFGKEYTAGEREQGKLMFDAFEALIERYPECVEALTQRTSIAKAEDVKNANTKDSDPSYFRGCKSFMVGNQEYLVGTSYGFKAKIAEIKGMFKICGANPSEFVLNGKVLAETPSGDSTTDSVEAGYIYTIFGEEYTAGSRDQGKLMYDVFEALIKRYPECAEKLTQRTSIAKAEDVKNANTKESNPTYFRGCKSFMVGNQEYLVGTSYGFDTKIAEIKGMFKICGADFGQFSIVSAPEKSTRSTNGKKGIGELINL